MSSKRILITGAGGFIGGGLFRKLNAYNPVGVILHSKEGGDGNFIQADLTDADRVKAVFDRVQPTTVFHFAAFLSPKRNEESPLQARETNIGITRNIVDNISGDTHIIFPSTDKVFDGVDPSPNEESPINPLWLYGELKAECEEIIKSKTGKYHIVRLPIVHSYGEPTRISTRSGRGSFIDRAIIDLKAGKTVTVFDNVERCFLRIEELLALFEVFIHDTHYGTFHVGTKMMNYYDRLCGLCEELNMGCEGRIIPTVGNARPRAQNLNTNKLKKTFGMVLT